MVIVYIYMFILNFLCVCACMYMFMFTLYYTVIIIFTTIIIIIIVVSFECKRFFRRPMPCCCPWKDLGHPASEGSNLAGRLPYLKSCIIILVFHPSPFPFPPSLPLLLL